ncbi:MAG: hypothetical protein Fur0010_18440 [Bdellovibrio sp.]
MNLFLPNEKHIEILDEIGRWKIIGLNDLFFMFGDGILYSSFSKRVRKLEAEGLIRSIVGHQRKKYLSLTIEGGRFSKFSSPYLENDNELRHDLIVSSALREFLKFRNFKSGYVMTEDLEVVPDALVYARKKEKEYSLAIEIELHQKSRKRLVDKFSRYGNSKIFNYVMYVTNKGSIFDSYRNLLLEMNDKIQGQIMILHDEGLRENRFDYLNSRIWFRKSNKTFSEIFE